MNNGQGWLFLQGDQHSNSINRCWGSAKLAICMFDSAVVLKSFSTWAVLSLLLDRKGLSLLLLCLGSLQIQASNNSPTIAAGLLISPEPRDLMLQSDFVM